MYVRDIDATLDGLGFAWGTLFSSALKVYETQAGLKQQKRQVGILEQQFRLQEARAKAAQERAARERAATPPVRAAGMLPGKLPGWVLPTAAIAGGALLLLPRLLK